MKRFPLWKSLLEHSALFYQAIPPLSLPVLYLLHGAGYDHNGRRKRTFENGAREYDRQRQVVTKRHNCL